MASLETLKLIQKVAGFATGNPLTKTANPLRALAGKGLSFLGGAAAAPFRAAGKAIYNNPGRAVAGLGAAGAYGAGYGAYHGLGKGTTGQQFDSNQGAMGYLQDQYKNDIERTRAGTYNPNTGADANSWYSTLFGYQGASPVEQRRLANEMQQKYDAAIAGRGHLGNYKGRNLWRNWFGSNHEQLQQQALGAAQAGTQQGHIRQGLLPWLTGKAFMDFRDPNVPEAQSKEMQAFIDKYGGGKSKPGVSDRFAYIGNRPTGPVDFSSLTNGTGFGHDYSGYYQPYPLAPR